MKTKLIITSGLALVMAFAFAGGVSMANVASSTNYAIERDSINFAGTLSSSTAYSLTDTVGEVGTGYSSSTNYTVSAGFQQPGYSISISSPSDVTLLPAINTLQGGQANGSAEWTVTTDSPAGYTLTIKADASPALRSATASFTNYAGAPDFTWSVASNASGFGFTPEGTDITFTYLDNTVSCGVGSTDTSSACWDSLTTSAKTIATSSSSNASSGGTLTTVRFRAEAGSSAVQAAGSYTTLVTLTATAL